VHPVFPLNYPQVAYPSSESGLLEDLSKSIYDFMVRSVFPMCWKDRKILVEAGLGRFVVETPTETGIIIAEPLAIISIMRYLESKGKAHISNALGTLQDNQGVGFEPAVLLGMTKLLQNRKPLREIVNFKELSPEWANCTAQLVRRSSTGFQNFDWNGSLPTTDLTHYAESIEEVKAWLESGTTAWCFPGKLIGPDIMARVMLSNRCLVLLAIQVKGHLSSNTNTVTADTATKAIRSLDPKNWYSSLVCSFHSHQI
jgi:hypothetical protein